MRTTIDKAGRVVIPGPIRRRASLEPGTELEIVVGEDGDVRLSRAVPGPELVRTADGRRVARPRARKLPSVDVAALVEEERSRWPW